MSFHYSVQLHWEVWYRYYRVGGGLQKQHTTYKIQIFDDKSFKESYETVAIDLTFKIKTIKVK